MSEPSLDFTKLLQSEGESEDTPPASTTDAPSPAPAGDEGVREPSLDFGTLFPEGVPDPAGDFIDPDTAGEGRRFPIPTPRPDRGTTIGDFSSILDDAPQNIPRMRQVNPDPFTLESIMTRMAQGLAPGILPEQVTRTTYYVPVGGDGEKDAKVVPVENPRKYYTQNVAQDLFQAGANGTINGIFEIYEFATGVNPREAYPEYFSKDFATKKQINQKDLAAQLVFEMAEMLPAGFLTFKTGGVALSALSKGAKVTRMYDLAKAMYANGFIRPALNPIHYTSTRLARLTPKALKESAKYGTAGAIGEQIITDKEEMMEIVENEDGVLLPRFANLLIEADYPLASDLGEYLKLNADKPELVNRALKLADDLLIGLTFDGTVYGITLFGMKVLAPMAKKLSDTDTIKKNVDELALENQTLDPSESFIDENTFDDFRTKYGESLTIEQLEEIAVMMEEDGGISKIFQYLDDAEKLTPELAKYLGSINATKVQTSEIEALMLIKHTAEALRDSAIRRGEEWPPTVEQMVTSENATLFGLENQDELLALLQDLNDEGSPLKMHSFISGVELGPDLSGAAVYAVAARRVLANSATHLARMAKDAQNAITGHEDAYQIAAAKASFFQAYLSHRKIQETVNGIANNAGRLLNSFNIPVTGDEKAEYIRKLMDVGGKDLEQFITKFAQAADSDVDMQKLLYSVDDEKVPFMTKMRSYWYNNILSALDTQAVNITGNAYVRLMRDLVETPIAAAINTVRANDPTGITFEDAFNRVTANFRQSSVNTFIGPTEIQTKVYHMLNPYLFEEMYGQKFAKIEDVYAHLSAKGVKNPDQYLGNMALKEIEMETMAGMSNMFKALKLMKAAFFEDPALMRRFNMDANEFVERGSQRLFNNPLDYVARYATRGMGAFDAFFKSLSQNAALHEGAGRMIRNMRIEIQESGKPITLKLGDGTTAVVTERMLDPNLGNGEVVAQLMNKIVSSPPKTLLDYANAEMRRDVFQEDTIVNRSITGIRNIMDKLPLLPLGTMLAPFIRTPVNLVIYNIDRVPLVALLNSRNRAELKGPTAARDMQLARRSAGVAVLSLGYYLAQEGLITGGEHFDPKQRQLQQTTGFRPYAYVDKETGKHYTMTRFDPATMLLGFGANIYRSYYQFLNDPNLTEAERQDAGKRIASMAHSLYKTTATLMSDRLFLQSLSEVANIFGNPYVEDKLSYAGEQLAKIVGNAASGMVPFSTLVSRAAEAINLTSKEMQNKDEYYKKFSLDERVKLRRDAFAAYDANMFANAAVREESIFQGTMEKVLVLATRRFPGVQTALVGDLFPKVDQFGRERPRDIPIPIGVPVTRTGANPPLRLVTDESGDERKDIDELAFLSHELIRYGFNDVRVDRDIVTNQGVKIRLNAKQYYYRSKIQGTHMANQLRNFFVQEGHEDGTYSTEYIKEKIRAIQTHSKEYATALVLRHFDDLEDTGKQRIKAKTLMETKEAADETALETYDKIRELSKQGSKIQLRDPQ